MNTSECMTNYMPKPSEILGKPEDKPEKRTEIFMSIACMLCNSQNTRTFRTKEYGKFQVDCADCERTAEFNMGWEPGV